MEMISNASAYYLHLLRGSALEGCDRMFKCERIQALPCFPEHSNNSANVTMTVTGGAHAYGHCTCAGGILSLSHT